MKRLITMVAGLSLVLSLALSLAPSAFAIPGRPSPARLVNDLAGTFSSRQAEELERVLVAFDDSTSNQIAVVTVKDLEGYEPSEYATRIGLDWGVGSEKFDNGIVILVKPKDRTAGKVFIAVGYGLEGAIPDAYAKRIINEVMIPHFMNEDYYGGVAEACKVLMKLASGEISELREDDFGEDDAGAIAAGILMLLIIVFVLVILSKSQSGGPGSGSGSGPGSGRGRTIYTGPIITTGRPYSGWGSSGGSFGGGFGGGFGGFGGGSFGGGGAGGSW